MGEQIEIVRDWPGSRLIADAERCADLLASNGVMLWWPATAVARQRRYAGKPLNGCEGVEADPDEVFAALPRGLAILSLRKHGVEFDTMHLCDNRHDGKCEREQVSFSCAPDGDDVKARGATFTPRALAEQVTNGALEAVVYRPGPLDTASRDEWRQIPVGDILDKTVADIAMGSGVFPLAALRFLTERILDQLPPDWRVHREQDIRAAVIARCLYGVDIHPGSVAIARLVMALMVPLVDIDVHIYRHFRCGDSLLGITSLDQLRWMHLHPERGREIHKTQPIPEHLIEEVA